MFILHPLADWIVSIVLLGSSSSIPSSNFIYLTFPTFVNEFHSAILVAKLAFFINYDSPNLLFIVWSIDHRIFFESLLFHSIIYPKHFTI